jgi:hypothetical protein
MTAGCDNQRGIIPPNKQCDHHQGYSVLSTALAGAKNA